MVGSKKRRFFNYIIFLIPALFVYLLFFINPFINGIKLSFTNWNGVTPDIPFNMKASDFQSVITKISNLNPGEARYVIKYYNLDDAGDEYNLVQWFIITNKDGTVSQKQLLGSERSALKGIFASVGVTPISNIGFANYKAIFTTDSRFFPQLTKHNIYNNKLDPLPPQISTGDFNYNLLAHIKDPDDRSLTGSVYAYDKKSDSYLLSSTVSSNEQEGMKDILMKYFFRNDFSYGVIGFTLLFTIGNVIFANFLAIMLALFLDKKLKTANALRAIFFMPTVLSMVVVAFIWQFLFTYVIPPFFVTNGIHSWLGNPDVAPYATIIVTVWQGLGYLMVIYLAGLQGIPTEIIEVSRIDGAEGLRKFFDITLPLLMPAATICLFYSLSNGLKAFDSVYVLTGGGGPVYSTTNFVIDIFNNAFIDHQFAYATAKAIVLCIVIMILTGIQLGVMKGKEIEL